MNNREFLDKGVGKFEPVLFDVEGALAEWSKDPEFKAAYAALEDEYAVLDTLLKARKKAGLTQAEIAQRMRVKQSSLGRIETSLVSRRHSPSLATLRKYAEACGKKLVIKIV